MPQESLNYRKFVNSIIVPVFLQIFTEIILYFRSIFLSPMVIAFGAVYAFVLVTFWSLWRPDLTLPALPFIPSSFTLDQYSLLKIWAFFSLALYFIEKLFSRLFGINFQITRLNKIKYLFIGLTAPYLFLILATYLGVGIWRNGGTGITGVFIVLYILMFLTSLISSLAIFVLDFFLSLTKQALKRQGSLLEESIVSK